jgi:phosphate/sulfate permease
MTVGSSIFLIAVGAILRYAVTDSVSGVDLTTIGLILMIAGIVGLVIGLFMMTTARRDVRDVEYRDRRPPL